MSQGNYLFILGNHSYVTFLTNTYFQSQNKNVRYVNGSAIIKTLFPIPL